MNDKYRFTDETITIGNHILHRIQATKSFGHVTAGDIGGYIESEGNLSTEGEAWVADEACVYGNAWAFGNACVSDNAWVCGYAWVYDSAHVDRSAQIFKANHLLTVGAIGSRDDTTTFYRTSTHKIFVKCGCFLGDIDEFEARVKKTHDCNKHAQVYMLAAQMARIQINLDD